MRGWIVDISDRYAPPGNGVRSSRDARSAIRELNSGERAFEVLFLHWNNDDLKNTGNAVGDGCALVPLAVALKIRIVLFSGGAENAMSHRLRDELEALGYSEWTDFVILSEITLKNAINWDVFDGLEAIPPASVVEVIRGGIDEKREAMWLLLTASNVTF